MNNGILSQSLDQGITLPFPMQEQRSVIVNTYGIQSLSRQPNQISNLLAWYDAADLKTLFINSNGTNPVSSNNNPIGCWLDKGPSRFHMTQSTNNNRPILNISPQSVNRLPSVLFDGINDFLFNSIPFVLNTLLTISFVVQRQSDTVAPHVAPIITCGRAGSSDNLLEISLRNTYATAGTENDLRGGGMRRNGRQSVSTGNAPTSFMIGSSTWGIRTIANLSDGTILGALRDSSGDIGFTCCGNFFLPGRICELIIHSRILTISERISLEVYLSNKWNIGITL
jgi:hypothetical protein